MKQKFFGLVLTLAAAAAFGPAHAQQKLVPAQSEITFVSKQMGVPVEGRFRKFSRGEIKARGDSLDIAWLKDESGAAAGELLPPEDLAQLAIAELQGAMDELRAILAEFGIEEEDA